MPPELLPSDCLDRRSFVRAATISTAAALGLAGDASGRPPFAAQLRVRIWCEGTAPRAVYPEGVDGALGDAFRHHPGMIVSQGRLNDPDSGLSDAALDATDSLVWWGRLRHEDLPESRARAVVDRVKAGKLGLVALHGSYASKPFRALLGSSCMPRAWREDGKPEHVKVTAADHPIARGVSPFTIPKTAMFAEPFDVPEPEAVVLVSSWNGGETFRSGLTWTVGQGRVAYFRPGHDGFPVLFHPGVRQVIANAAMWASPTRPVG